LYSGGSGGSDTGDWVKVEGEPVQVRKDAAKLSSREKTGEISPCLEAWLVPFNTRDESLTEDENKWLSASIGVG